jgi:hypothetical protein
VSTETGQEQGCREFRKNSWEVVRVRRTEFKGTRCVDVRVWAESSDGTGMVPTRKGLTVRAELLDELIRALVSLRDEEEGGDEWDT